MTLTVEATYENGVLKPAQPLPLREFERVEVMIRTLLPNHSDSSTTPPVRARQEALKRLLSLQLPVADWDQMEQEIIRGAVE
jgi:predicted DNA-binding antitoxin AbrB/MazE fold protein